MSEPRGARKNSSTEAIPERRRFERRTDGKVVAGVCSGLGTYFDVDPLWFRIGFVVVSLPGALGLILYLAAWALMPLPGEPSPMQRKRAPVTWVGVVLLAIAVMMMLPLLEALLRFVMSPLSPVGFDYPTGNYFPGPAFLALGFIAIGVLLLRQRDEGRGPLAPSDRQPVSEEAMTDRSSVETRETTTPMTYAPDYAPAPVRRRERSALSAFVIAAVLLIVGTAAVISSAELVDIDVGQLTALALFIVGSGLIVGAWWGRARLMIVLGLVMVPVVLATSVIDYPLTGGIGGGYIAPRTEAQLHDLDYTVGDIQLDFSNYRFDEGAAEVNIRMGVGALQIVVPKQVHAIVAVDIRSGEAHVFKSDETGADISFQTEAGEVDVTKRLRINVTGGLVSMHVFRTNYGYLQRVEKREDRAQRKRDDASRKERGDRKGRKGDKR